mmetsp:Transcript_9719/g.24215  ORF Transcript_9719/g.24215 Transcript_9719/m.24215 type:complete len:211 (-) Transcript_9719:973-1605(-)
MHRGWRQRIISHFDHLVPTSHSVGRRVAALGGIGGGRLGFGSSARRILGQTRVRRRSRGITSGARGGTILCQTRARGHPGCLERRFQQGIAGAFGTCRGQHGVAVPIARHQRQQERPRFGTKDQDASHSQKRSVLFQPHAAAVVGKVPRPAIRLRSFVPKDCPGCHEHRVHLRKRCRSSGTSHWKSRCLLCPGANGSHESLWLLQTHHDG